MTEHELRCEIAKHSADPDNEVSMALAAFYSACLREMTGPVDDEEATQ